MEKEGGGGEIGREAGKELGAGEITIAGVCERNTASSLLP